MHHVGIDPAEPGVAKYSGQRPDDVKSAGFQRRTAQSFEATTKLNCIAANPSRAAQGAAGGYVTAVSYVRSAAKCVRLKEIRADNGAVFFCYEHRMGRGVPPDRITGSKMLQIASASESLYKRIRMAILRYRKLEATSPQTCAQSSASSCRGPWDEIA